MADHVHITQIRFSAESEVIIKQNDEDNSIDMIQNFNAINIEFLREPEVKKIKIKRRWKFLHHIFTFKKIKLIPRDSAMLNLRLKVNLPDEIEAMVGLAFLPENLQ